MAATGGKKGRLVQQHNKGLLWDCYVMHFLKDLINSQCTQQHTAVLSGKIPALCADMHAYYHGHQMICINIYIAYADTPRS